MTDDANRPDMARPIPASGWDVFMGVVGAIARPYAVIVTSTGVAIATVIVAVKVENGNDGAIFLGAAFAGVAAIYIGKAVEVFKQSRAAADVEIAKANNPPAA